MRERLWPADTFVDFDHSLNTAIKKLRQALGDSALNPRFIETLARRGYRFIAPVSALPSAAGEASVEAPAAPTALVGNEVPPPQPAAAPAMSARRVRVAMLALACVSLLVLIAVVWNTRQYSSARPPSQPAAAPAVQLAVLPLKVRAIQLEPEYALARAGLATAFAWFSVRYAYQKDALSWGKRAEEEALRTLAIDHDMAEAHFAIAAAAGTVYGRFDWGKLLAEVDEAIRLDPTLDIAYASRARGLYHLGLFDAAHAAASKAIALNPDGNVETHRLLVVMSLLSGRFAEAAKGAEDLMRRSDAPVIRLYLGQALFYLGKPQEAADLLAGVRRGA